MRIDARPSELFPLVILAFCGLFAAQSHAEAEVARLVYAQTLTTDRAETTNQPAGQDVHKGPLEVWLTANRFAVRSDGAWVVYDFATEKITTTDPVTGTALHWPLFADLAFRAIEMQNRVRINSALLGAGLDRKESATDIRNLRDLETLFGLPWPHPVQGLPLGRVEVTEPVPGTWRLTHDELTAASVEVDREANAWPQAIRDMQAKFLLYQCRMHPTLWEAVSTVDRPITALELRWRNMFSGHHRILQLTEVEVDATWPIELDQLRPETRLNLPTFEGTTPIGRWVDRFTTGQELPARPTAEQIRRAASEAADRDRPLDAVLALMSLTLQENFDIRQELGELVNQFSEDAQLQAYLHANQPPDEQDPRSRREKMQAIDRAGLKFGHLLDIFIANEAAAEGDFEAAYRLFAQALDINPHLTGVWHDLGQISFRQYDTYTAWSCIETARRIEPQHGMLRGVDDFETKLRQDFPRYFQ